MRKIILILAVVMVAGCEYIPTEKKCNYVMPTNYHLVYDSVDRDYYVLHIDNIYGMAIYRYLYRYSTGIIRGFHSLGDAKSYKDSCNAKGMAMDFINQEGVELSKRVKVVR
jgi:hypothetical protein